MDISILSFDKAVEFKPVSLLKTAAFRILEPKKDAAPLRYEAHFHSISELRFHDEVVIPGRLLPSNTKVFGVAEAAYVISRFKQIESYDSVMFHCAQGISRSPALALAFCWYIGNEEKEIEILKNRRFVPNPTVLACMANHLGIRCEKNEVIARFTDDGL